MLILKELKGERYLKEILILNSFCFEDKDPRFTRLKPGLALRLLSRASVQGVESLQGLIAGLFRQIWGHSSRFVLFYSF